MYLSVHATVGAVVGQQTGSPLLAFGAGFASHLLLDVIPHGDSAKSGMPQTNKMILIAASIDMFVLSIITAVLWSRYGESFFTPVLLAGAIGGMLPDALQTPYLFSGGKIFSWYQKFHNFFHNAIVLKWDFPYPIGIALQLLLLGMILFYKF